mgnify:CR=1 FL=1
MIRSMTGYGKGESRSERGCFTVEIRSVNHRYGEFSIRMPRGFLSLENRVKKQLGTVLKRGKVDVFIQWEESVNADGVPQPDHALARGYADMFRSLAVDLGVSVDIPLSLVITQRGVLKESITTVDEAEFVPQLELAINNALLAIDAMRCREGEALREDLGARRIQIAALVEQISERAHSVVIEYRQKLKNRLDQLLDGMEIDGARLAQEVALMADRCDVTEELVRLGSHFKQFDDTLTLPEPVGRKLDFLMQEMNREVNTIGSKSSDAEITSLVIRIKAEMEKMREQVQNVE